MVSSARLKSLFPALQWLEEYRVAWLRPDLVAGLTLAAFMLPESLAYASLAGLPPQAGLYATMLAGLAFVLFFSGRHTVIAVTSAISLLLASELGAMADGDPQRYYWLASITAIYVGVIAIIARVVKAGSVVAFVSDTILAGFKVGVALQIAVSQLPKLFGIEGGHGHFVEKALALARGIGETHWPSLAVGAGAIALMVLGERFLRNKPVDLIVVVLSILLIAFTGVGQMGIHILGQLPSGLPDFGVPPVRARDVDGLFALALACFLLATVETNAVSRTFGLKHGYRIDANQDFLAIGAANLLVGAGQGYPVSGGMSQSAVNDNAGAKTPLSLVVACFLLVLIAMFLGDAFRNLPEPILAAVVLMAIKGLVKPAVFRDLYRASRVEFAVAVVALIAVLGLGVLKGVLLAAVFSLLLLIQRAMHPLLAVLGQRPGADSFTEMRHDRDAKRLPGALLVKPYGALLYFNVEAVRARLFEIIAKEGRQPNLVLAMGAVPVLDLAGARFLGELREELARSGVVLRLAEVNESAFQTLKALELDRALAIELPNQSLGTVIARAGSAVRNG
jgi:high affinity sulfate transporter 1